MRIQMNYVIKGILKITSSNSNNEQNAEHAAEKLNIQKVIEK